MLDALGSIIGGVAAAVALIFVIVQIGQFVSANREAARPYVSIDAEFKVIGAKVARGLLPRDSLILLVVRNTGRSAARKLKLTVDRPFAPVTNAIMPAATAALNKLFSGEVLSTLNPGNQLKFPLDDPKKLLSKPDAELRYTIRCRYRDVNGHNYCEEHVIDLAPWRYSLADTAPIDEIVDELRRLADEMEHTSEVRPVRDQQLWERIERIAQPRISRPVAGRYARGPRR